MKIERVLVWVLPVFSPILVSLKIGREYKCSICYEVRVVKNHWRLILCRKSLKNSCKKPNFNASNHFLLDRDFFVVYYRNFSFIANIPWVHYGGFCLGNVSYVCVSIFDDDLPRSTSAQSCRRILQATVKITIRTKLQESIIYWTDQNTKEIKII